MSEAIQVNNEGNEQLNAAGGRRRGEGSGSVSRPGRVQSSTERLMAIQAAQKRVAARDPKAQALRQRMDERNTDRYYKGSQVSAIGVQSASDTTTSEGVVKPPRFRTALANLDERNTDRYYRDALVRPPTKQQIEQQAMKQNQPPRRVNQPRQSPPLPQQGTTLTPVHHAQNRHPLIVATRNDVRDQARTAAALLQQGHKSVVIKVTGPALLGMQVRTILDGMVGREEISEDQYRDIRIDVSQAGTADRVEETRSPDEIFGSPEKLAADATLPEPDEEFDPEAFLAGEGGADLDGVPPEAGPAQVVDDDDEDNDFAAQPQPHGEHGTVKNSIFDQEADDDFLSGEKKS